MPICYNERRYFSILEDLPDSWGAQRGTSVQAARSSRVRTTVLKADAGNSTQMLLNS